MACLDDLIAKENTKSSIAGKVNPSGGTNFSSIKKRSKALSDVKNTILQRKYESKLDPKKQLNFDDNNRFNVEKSLTEKPEEQNASSSTIVKECVLSVTSISENNFDIEEEIVSLPLCAASNVDDDEDDIDIIDDCPYCLKNDNFDDWDYGIGEREWSDEEIMKICFDPIPHQPPSPTENIDDWLKEEYKFTDSPCKAIEEIDDAMAFCSLLFRLPFALYHQDHEIAPVYNDD